MWVRAAWNRAWFQAAPSVAAAASRLLSRYTRQLGFVSAPRVDRAVRWVALGYPRIVGCRKQCLVCIDATPSRAIVPALNREIVGCVAQGFKNKEITEKLFISEGTVKNHLHNIFQKLGVSGRLELALYAINNNMRPR